MMRIPALAAFLLVTFLCCGCASTELVGTWQKPGYAGPPLQRVLVLGVSDREGARRRYEDQLVAELRSRGVDAIPGYSVVEESARLDRAKIGKAIEEAKVGGAIVTRLVRVDQGVDITPGYTRVTPWYTDFHGYYTSAWGLYDRPPEVRQYDIVTLETRLFDARSGEMVWSGTTRTFDPISEEAEVKKLARIIAQRLVEQKLVG